MTTADASSSAIALLATGDCMNRSGGVEPPLEHIIAARRLAYPVTPHRPPPAARVAALPDHQRGGHEAHDDGRDDRRRVRAGLLEDPAGQRDAERSRHLEGQEAAAT